MTTNENGHYIGAVKICIMIFLLCFMAYCGKSDNKTQSIEMISLSPAQESIFRNLVTLTNNSIPESELSDSLAFLILPVQASCPSCREKTIDSIVKNISRLSQGHFIIISANGGRKTINGFFREVNKELPLNSPKLFLDTINRALKFDLYDKKPTIYYTHKSKAYKKVAAIPATVKHDLQEFFSGYR